MTNSVTAPVGQALNILVAGMKPQTTYHMRAHVDWAGGSWVDQDQTFTTGALPTSPQAPALSVVAPLSQAWHPRQELNCSALSQLPVRVC
jgi:hypothetical protein